MKIVLSYIYAVCFLYNITAQDTLRGTNFNLPKPDTTKKTSSHNIGKYITISAQVVVLYQRPFNFTSHQLERNTGPALQWKPATVALFDVPVKIKPWKNAEVGLMPEYTWGSALAGGNGMGGYVNSVYGANSPSPYLFKAQFTQWIINKKENALVRGAKFVVGKMYMQELFQLGAYAGDPGADFLNFNHTMPAAWDVATTSFGYTYGVFSRLDLRNSEVNFAAITVNKKPSSAVTDWDLKNGHGFNLQYVRYFKIGSKYGSLRALGFGNRAYSGTYKHYEVDSLTGAAFFPDKLKSYNTKYGFVVDGDFAINGNTGIFARYSWNDGKTESMHFTEADQAIAVGVAVRFRKSKRTDDVLGAAVSMDMLSADHSEFLARGGTGFMLKSGTLDYTRESCFEIYYRIYVVKHVALTLNYQYVIHPGYDKQSGNADFVGCRANFSF